VVSDGAVKFNAYAKTGDTYKADDVVRVLIPNGDMTGVKTIEGLWPEDNKVEPYSALDGAVAVTNNLLTANSFSVAGLNVNTNLYNAIIIKAYFISSSKENKPNLSLSINGQIYEVLTAE
jgi:hypothetical protein